MNSVKTRSPGKQFCYHSRSGLPGNLGVVFPGRINKKSNSPGIWDIIIFTITHPTLEAETCRTGPGAGGAVGNWEAPTQTGPFRAENAPTKAHTMTGIVPFFPFPLNVFLRKACPGAIISQRTFCGGWESCSESRGVSLSRSLGLWPLGLTPDPACPSGCGPWGRFHPSGCACRDRFPVPDPVPQDGVVRIDPAPQDVGIRIDPCSRPSGCVCWD